MILTQKRIPELSPAWERKANKLLKSVKDKLVKKSFVSGHQVTKFYIACAKHLMKNLPLNQQVIHDVQYLHPMLRNEKIMEKPLKRLAGTVAKCLGESFHDLFQLEKSCTVDEFENIVKSEIDFYRIEMIPDSMIFLEKPEVKKASQQKTSYWKDAFDILAGVRIDKTEENNFVYRRVDNFWLDVLDMKDVASGNQKYKHLAKLALCCLVLSHGNAEPERGFSIDKYLLKVHGNAIEDESILLLFG